MAAIGAALMGKVLGHSEAEKAFRPWWDSLEDYLIYGLVMIGVVCKTFGEDELTLSREFRCLQLEQRNTAWSSAQMSERYQ